MRLSIQGLGIIFYSPFAAEHIRKGEDYLNKRYLKPEDVVPHILAGTVVGFGTGSPGTFELRFRAGYPSDDELESHDCKLRLGLEVRDETLCVRDLYDLLRWQRRCPDGQRLTLADGYYHVTLVSSAPPSGILGDDQVIDVYLNPLSTMPSLKYDGVPMLCE